MKNLIIIGARGSGRQCYNLFCYIKTFDQMKDVQFKGFLDDKKDALDSFKGYPPILSSPEDYIIEEDDVFLCALGDPKWVKYYSSMIEYKGGKFISLISPNAIISQNVRIGKGCVISHYAFISCDIEIGNHSFIGNFCNIGHDAKIRNFCHLGAYSFMGGFSHLDNSVTVHPRVNILPHKKVGEEAILGAGSVIIRNVKPNTTVFGVPAKKI